MRYLVTLTILAMPVFASGQDSTFLEPEMVSALQWETNRQDYVAFRATGGVPVRGQAFDDTTGSDVSYDDLFRIGVTGAVEGGILFRSPKNYWTGAYVSLGGAVFKGDSHRTTIGKLEVDDLEMITAMAGVRIIRYTEAGSTMEIYLAGGWMAYGALDGKISGTAGDVDIYDRSGSAVGDAGVRLGWGDKDLAFQVGLSGRVAKGPKMASGFIDRGDAGTMLSVHLDIGLQFGF